MQHLSISTSTASLHKSFERPDADWAWAEAFATPSYCSSSLGHRLRELPALSAQLQGFDRHDL